MGNPKARCISASVCVIVIALLFYGLFTPFVAVPAYNPKEYTSANCYVAKCFISGTYQNETNFITYISLTYGLNGYNNTVQETLYYDAVSYCNITSIECYHYVDDITSLTLDESDVQPAKDATTIVIVVYVIFTIIGIPVCALIFFLLCSLIWDD